MASMKQPLRIGYVPEHFSTPLHFAQKYFGLDAQLIPFPSGTGHMVTALRAADIDVGIGLTEGWVAGLGREELEGDGGYRLIGTYVETPLCWAVSTGAHRSFTSVTDLKGGRCGVSRLGSGSHIMSYALALQEGWLAGSPEPMEHVVLQTFEGLRKAVNDGTADFFMWEHFTSQKYYATKEIKKVGEIYTPWSSWKIVVSTAIPTSDARVEETLEKLDKGIRYFQNNREEAVKYISTALDYSAADARTWYATVRFASATKGVDVDVVRKTVELLRTAGILGASGMTADDMVALSRPGRSSAT